MSHVRAEWRNWLPTADSDGKTLLGEIAEGFEALAAGHREHSSAVRLHGIKTVNQPVDPAADTVMLRELLVTLETTLHDPSFRRDHARVDALLHPDFEEVGRSGSRYTRAGTIAALASEPPCRNAIMSDGFALTVLGEDAALLTYRTAERAASGGIARHAHRCSLWLRAAGRWRVRYHQATPMGEPRN